MAKNGERDERETRESRLASGWTVEAQSASAEPFEVVAPGAGPADAGGASEGAAETTNDDDEGYEAPAQMSNLMLVLLGLIGGVYLLYTMVWFSWANVYASVNSLAAEGSGSLGAVMQQLVFWAAPLAPILWFLSVLVLQRPYGGAAARPGRVVLWLIVGLVVLLPLPMFETGAAA